MRVVKQAEERKKEILDAAEILFFQKGFDSTSTKDILERVGIARGTLYHHFESKEAIMDALIERYNVILISSAGTAASDRSVHVYERILKTILALNISNIHESEDSEKIMEYMHRPQNALMHQKQNRMIIEKVTPILADIIRDGIEQKIFSTPYPEEAVEMMLSYTNTVFDNDLLELSEEEMVKRIKAFIFNMERLLGADSGSFPFTEEMFGST